MNGESWRETSLRGSSKRETPVRATRASGATAAAQETAPPAEQEAHERRGPQDRLAGLPGGRGIFVPVPVPDLRRHALPEFRAGEPACQVFLLIVFVVLGPIGVFQGVNAVANKEMTPGHRIGWFAWETHHSGTGAVILGVGHYLVGVFMLGVGLYGLRFHKWGWQAGLRETKSAHSPSWASITYLTYPLSARYTWGFRVPYSEADRAVRLSILAVAVSTGRRCGASVGRAWRRQITFHRRRRRPACAEGRPDVLAMVRTGLAAQRQSAPMRVRPTDPTRAPRALAALTLRFASRLTEGVLGRLLTIRVAYALLIRQPGKGSSWRHPLRPPPVWK